MLVTKSTRPACSAASSLSGSTRIPPDVLLITVGADVQDDRIEVSYVGWAKDGTAYVLGHVVLHGPVTAPGVWTDLDDLLRQRWHTPIRRNDRNRLRDHRRR